MTDSSETPAPPEPAGRDEEFAAALAATDATGKTRLRRFFDHLITKAIKGDPEASREVLKRIDGGAAASPDTAFDAKAVAYVPRPQFEAFHARAQRFACIVAHRRAGKTLASLHDLQRRVLACDEPRPRMAYVAPYLRQAKAVAWDHLLAAMSGLRAQGARVHEGELRVDYPNGGQIRLYGADNPDALRGLYFDGVVLDEYADIDPRVYAEIIRPALVDREGFATFIGTPRGRNAFHEVWQSAQADPGWFALMLKASETGLIPAHELADARRALTEEQYAQEFECSFEAAIQGAYYGKLIAEAERDGRIAPMAHEPAALVWTAWDLGIRDATAIWFAQVVGKEVRLIDYYEAAGVDLGHYVRELERRGYTYAGHILPHDAQSRELGSGKSRFEVMQSLGCRNLRLAPLHRVEDGINAVRLMLPRCRFDAVKCARGIEALRLYRTDYDGKLQVFRPHPVHDWTSHAADAFRYLAMTLDDATRGPKNFYRKIEYRDTGWR